MRRHTAVYALAGLILVLSACIATDTRADSSISPTSGSQPQPTTTPVTETTNELSNMSVAELHAHAVEFSDTYHRSWPDIEFALERFADDVVFYDPADGDFIIEGSTVIVPILRNFVRHFPNVAPVVAEVFVSADGAAYRSVYGHGYWPPWSTEPSGHRPVVDLNVFHFEGDSVTGFDIWFEDDSLETMGFGCFANNGCPELGVIVERYVTAWTSGDPDQIAALYADNATFVDNLNGIAAVGPSEISSTSRARFGQGDFILEVIAVYAQTNGPGLPTEADLDLGELIAVGLHYRVSSPNGDYAASDSLTTFEFGTPRTDGFTPHPQDLITREEVFHNPDTFANIAG